MATPRRLKPLPSGLPGYFTTVGQNLFFVCPEDSTGQELWVSDGTPGGTRLVRDILPGPTPSLTRALTAFDGKLYFASSDYTTAQQLWISDGSESGTKPLASIYPEAFSMWADHLEVFNGSLYYASGDYSKTGVELWRFDPRTGETSLVGDINPNQQMGSHPGNLTAAGSTLYFTADDGSGKGEELWKFDGSTIELVKDVQEGYFSSSPSNLTGIDSQLYFTATTEAAGFELWKSDGTTEGTTLVADLIPGSASSFPRYLTAIGKRLFFVANGSNGLPGLWALDTSRQSSVPEALTQVSQFNALNFGPPMVVGTTLYFTAGSRTRELWTSDGTFAGTRKAMEIEGGIFSHHVIGNKLFFTSGNAGEQGLYVLDLAVQPPPPLSLPPTLTIAPLSGTLADNFEGNTGFTPFTFRITRTGDLSKPSQARWQVGFTPQPTVSPSDFDGGEIHGTVSFAGNESSKTLTVRVKGDSERESNESFFVYLTPLDNGNAGIGTSSFANALIRNDDNGAPPPSDFASSWTTAMALVDWSKVNLLALLNALPKSPKSQFSISLPRLSAPPAQPSNYTLVFTGENMQLKDSSKLSAPSSWGGTVSKVELKSGSASLASAALKPTALKDIAQKILADLGDAVPGLGQPTLQFLQQRLDVPRVDVPLLSIVSKGGGGIKEGQGGNTTPYIFTVSRSGSDLSGSCRANWTVAGSGGTPAKADDFVGGFFPSGTISFGRNERSKTITVRVKGDSAVEESEAFKVTLSSPSGVALDPTKTTATNRIINDDLPEVRLNLETPTSVNENGGQSLRFVFTRSVATTSPLVVNFEAATRAKDSATPGSDFTGNVLPTPGFGSGNRNPLASFTIPAGASKATLIVTPKPDSDLEANEKVTITLKESNKFSSSYTLPRQGLSKTGLILNDDLPKVSLSIEGATQVREDGPANLRYVFSREGSTAAAQIVNFSVSGTASPDSDYTGIDTRGSRKSVTIPKGASRVAVTVDPKPDAVPESNETVVLTLENGTGYSFGNARSATGTITGPTVQPIDSGFLEGELIVFNIQTTANTRVSWDLTGPGVDDADFNFGSPSFRRSGDIDSGRDGKLTIGYLSRKDFKSEGPERLTLSLRSGGKEIGSSTVVLLDASESPVVRTNVTSAIEGSENFPLVTTFQAVGQDAGTRIWWKFLPPTTGKGITFINQDDVELGTMSNSEVINDSNQVILRHTFKKDLRSEGTEGATIQFYADAQYKQPIGNMVSFTVRDTSPLTGYAFTNITPLNPLGYSDVTEGGSYTINVNKLANTDRETQLKWGIFDSSGNPLSNSPAKGTASGSDFNGLQQNVWNSLTFEQGRSNIPITLSSISDSKPEGMETAYLWFYLPERDNKKKPTENPAYVQHPLQIHENPFYILGRSSIAPEGDKAAMTVTRYGGGSNQTSVILKAESISQRYPGTYKNQQGFATPGDDFDPVTRTLTFRRDETQTFGTNLKADAVSEAGGEIFAWSLRDGSKLLDVRATTITNRTNPTVQTASYALSSLKVNPNGLPDLWGQVGSFFQWAGGGITNTISNVASSIQKFITDIQNKPLVVWPSPSQATRVATLRTYDRVTGQPLGLAAINKGFVSTLTGSVGAGLVGNDSASLISQGGGNLVAQGGGNLVAQGGGTLVAQGGGNIVQLNNGQALLPSSTIFTPSNFGTAISSNSYAALSALRDQSGNLIANGSGK